MESKKTKSTMWSPCEGEFPIIAYTTFKETGYPTEEGMKLVEECGFNVILENPQGATARENYPVEFGAPEEDFDNYRNNHTASINRIFNSIKNTNLKVILGGWQLYKSFYDPETGKLMDSIQIQGVYPLTSNDTLKFRPYQETYSEITKRYVDKYKDNPQLGGWSVVDEPSEPILYRLKNYYDKILSLDTEHPLLINLVAVEKQINYEFVKSYVTLFKPEILCYDFYPMKSVLADGRNSIITDSTIKIGESRDVHITADWKLFYNNLELFSSIVKGEINFFNKNESYLEDSDQKSDYPTENTRFWAFVQSLSYVNKDVYRPDAQEAFMRYEAFSALAYGAQGIIFWTYYHRQSAGEELFLSALVDGIPYTQKEIDEAKKNGKDLTYEQVYRKLPQWYFSKKVISEIKYYQHIFLGCTTTCAHTGNDNFWECLEKTDGKDEYFKKPEIKKLSLPFGPITQVSNADKNDGFLFSIISNGNARYIMVVNHSPVLAQPISFTYKSNIFRDGDSGTGFITINPPVVFPPFPPIPTPITPKEYKISQIVPPGGYLIIRYQ